MGFEGSGLYVSMSLEPSSSYRKLSKAGKWDERGDFRISFDGEILIYGVSLFIDNLADSIIKLETRIEQTEESIKLAATKEYVDEETGKVYTKYDSQLNITSQQISAVSTRVDNIKNTIDTAGWITSAEGNTLFAAKSLEDGNKIISYINQTATTTTIKSNRINLLGAVTYSDLDSALQDKVDAAGGDALDKALEAYEKASDAYGRANSAHELADSAGSTASSAYSRASEAITNAANALSAAQEAQTSVDRLPGWSKEVDIITALEDATVIVKGYISTSMIDVDNLYVKKLAATEGTVGAFKIMSYKSLETDDADAFIRMHEAGQVFTFIYAGHVESHSGKGAALIGIADNSDSMALYTEGGITFKGLSTVAESSYWKPLLIHSNTGEIRRSS